MRSKEILEELKALGSETTKKTLVRHGAPEPFYGVKIEDMKKLIKQIKVKKDYQLAIELYDTGVSDAMYMAGLIADENKMSREDLQKWAEKASWSMISEYTVPWVTAESPHGWEMALEWIDSPKENIAAAGWSTLSGLV